jgi:CubicO group peptidase (beta-lactamase class C family)
MYQEKWKNLEQTVLKEYSNTTGIVILQEGEPLYEGCFQGNSPSDAMHVFSVTKSVCSALVGIAIGQGYVKSVDQPVLDFLPEYQPDKANKTACLVTIRHLLTMTAPFRYEAEPFAEYFQSEDRLQTSLHYLGGEEKPGRFRYSPFMSAHILSGILASTTGRSMLDFAAENLLAPLGIDAPNAVTLHGEQDYWAWHGKPRHEPSWVADPQGINPGSWGLCLTPMAMAKLGQLYVSGGVWDGRQIIPASWVRESTKVQSRWEETGLGYGFLWWVLEDGVYAALGDGGNVIYGNEKTGTVIAMTCRFEENAKDRIELIRGVMEPMAAKQFRSAQI